MNLGRLILREIAHRKLGFVLGLVSVVAAAACLVGAVTTLKVYDHKTGDVLAAKEAEVQERVDETSRQVEARVAARRAEVKARGEQLEDEMRKITKGLGFNILILPRDQQLSALFADDYASKYMPQSYAKKLADSKIVTINHLLPSLEQRVKWPERNDRTMILIGTKGEVPLSHRDPKKPLLDPVPAGSIILGNELARTEGLKTDDTVELMGRSFKVSQVYEPRGDKRDITAWINLDEAQAMLDKPGQINAIWALECKCAFADLPKVRGEIESILPDTQVIEKGTIALARAEARQQAEVVAKDSLAQAEREAAVEIQAAKDDATAAVQAEAVGRAELRRQRASLIGVIAGLVVVAAAVWVGLLTLGNVRQRRNEIGLLRALGLRASQVFAVFLAKAAAMGLIGAVGGVALGVGVGLWAGSVLEDVELGGAAGGAIDPVLIMATIVAAPFVAIAAGWVPAMAAAKQDPAVVLREE